ncbi:MAG: nucleoside deaminase [Pseudomonadota bacterium]
MERFPHMARALELAAEAGKAGEVPVGAVLVGPDGMVLAEARNSMRADHDPTAHAEIAAIRAACAASGSERLVGCDLYVTLEPCPMCAAAISAARIARLYYGASDPKSGGVEQGPRIFSHRQAHHVPEIYDGVGARQAEGLLKSFFSARR